MSKPSSLQVIVTADGSPSLELSESDETYHSRHGALTESIHVFIESGLRFVLQQKKEVDILEVGLGSGLNAALTALEVEPEKFEVQYTALEPLPLSLELLEELNSKWTGHESLKSLLEKVHVGQWSDFFSVTETFTLKKVNQSIQEYQCADRSYDLIYYDAFGPRVQPEMWTIQIFDKLYQMLKSGGCLVTYCAKGQVRRDMQATGFLVERLPGPPHKREMIRAKKI